MSSLTVEEDQKWVPTHVQVTVLRGRGLRGKGKHGTSDVYTIIQLGKEKYSTGVAEKTTEPEWKEECSFELQPSVLESGCPAGSNELVLTVMHRALIGLDVFLGQAVIRLDKVFSETRCVKNEWYRLNSKTGKKEKERGDIQVTVQFTRNNLTASMYDLVMKDKSASTFGKLKERMRGKRRSSDEDSSSAVLPSGYGSLYRMRTRLPSDGGGEEDYEDDEGGEVRRSKMRTFFLRGKLRKSSDTRSSTSLGSESSESSSRGGSLSPTAGISVVVSDLSNSPSNSSNLTVDNSPDHTADTSPKLSPLKSEYGDEAGEITIPVPQPTVCVNGSHSYSVQPLDPGSGKPVDSFGLGLLPKSLPLSMSLQNLSPHTSTLPKSPAGDGRRWSFDKPDEEEKAAIAAALEKSGPMLADEEERLGQAAPHKEATSSSSSSTAELESQGKKQRRNLFSHGRSESAGKGQSQSKDESEQAPAASEEKHRGWFGSKDSHSKPSLVVSPKLEPSTDLHPPPLPTCHHPSGPPVDPTSVVSPLHHTNPFCHSQSTSPPMSPCNPFLSRVQHNPFYEDVLTAKPLQSSLPPLPYLSSSRPPISQLFPQATNQHNTPTTEGSIVGTDPKTKVMAKVEKRPLPPIPTEEERPFNKKSANPFTTAGELDSEWDESFEAFAAGRLQSPEDLTADCKTQQNTLSDHPLERCINKGALLLPISDADQDTNVNEALHHQPCTEYVYEAHKAVSQVANTNTHHFDTFAQFLETIPEHSSFESEHLTLNSPTSSPNLASCTETDYTNSTTNTTDLMDANMHQTLSQSSSVKVNSSSPDLGSSGLGSLAEEDFLSCLSSYSDKFSSSEEAEAQNSESNLSNLEQSPQTGVVKHLKPSESEDDLTDRSLVESSQNTIIQDTDGNEEKDVTNVDGSLESQSPVQQQPGIPPGEIKTTHKDSGVPNSNISLLSGSSDTKIDMNVLDRPWGTQSPVLVDQENVTTAREKGDEDQAAETPKVSKQMPKSDISLPFGCSLEEPHFPVCTIAAKEFGADHEETCPQKLLEQTTKLDSENGETVEDLPEILDDSVVFLSKPINATTPKSPDQEPHPTPPSLHIIFSTPDSNSSDLPVESVSLGGLGTGQQSPIPFGLFDDFLDTSAITSGASQGLDGTLSHTPLSDKSNSSFCQSFYLSTDSQAYQTCVSEPVSESNETLNSANSTIVGNLSETNTSKPSSAEICQKDHLEESYHGAEGVTATLVPALTKENNSGLEIPLAASAISNISSNPIQLTFMSNEDTISEHKSQPAGSDLLTFQNGVSDPLSKFPSGSEPNETSKSTNLMFCGELSESQETDGANFSQSTDILNQEISQKDQLEGFIHGAQDDTATLEPIPTKGSDFGLEVHPAAITDSGGVLESQQAVSGDPYTNCPQAQVALLQRSFSEGTLTPAFDDLLLPSFGSDPGAVQESSSAQLDPNLPSLTSFPSSLTPDQSSSPVALSSLPSYANATANSTPSMARDAAPKPVLRETDPRQQQLGDQEENR
ncbi:rab11 family-interacting protein 1 isoform X1 [Xyrichtys novacula]|uniref:Rab11 family-interacting protein 1 isoform X1 n=1 Tax=Xyrichtys novacula TaxID=13765 RepID=A0AAV1GM89_XYRNO|nr:rab11 family-interacting protein 1 isoform X1 [Xyrichtys novacula]